MMDPQKKKLCDTLVILYLFVGCNVDQARSNFHLYLFPVEAI
jgi:hypothetical protein